MKRPNQTLTILLSLCAVVFATRHIITANESGFAATHAVKPPTAAEIERERQEEEALQRALQAGEHHAPLKMLMDTAGINDPTFIEAEQSKEAEQAEVIGVVLSGQAFAFPLTSLSGPEQHVVNFATREGAISVSYCDLSGCVRVFHQASDTAIALGVGGLDIHEEMVLQLDGVRYSQNSPDIPLSDYPFTQTTWGDWIHRHPDSLMYLKPRPRAG